VRRLGFAGPVRLIDVVDLVGPLAFLESVDRPTHRLDHHLDHTTSGHADRLDALHG
jgi:hypothetical protein